MNLVTIALTAALVTAGAAPAHAEWLYSVDINSNSLARVNAATGAIETIGPLTGFIGTVTDMEFVGERLYALANVSPNKALLELNIATGAIISNVVINEKGTPITNAAEGLGSDASGNLLISFWFPGSTTTTSGQIGLLNFDGSIASSALVGVDMDGLTRRFAGNLYALDRDLSTMTNTILIVTPSPPQVSTLISIPFDAVINGVDDLTQTRTGLYMLDFATHRVIKLDPATGAVVSSVQYTGATFVQVAAPPPCRGDADGDGDRDFADITAVLTLFGTSIFPNAPGDADGDGDVDFADITSVLEVFSTPCPF